jgi:DNA-binding MarR family transcriptional regulator
MRITPNDILGATSSASRSQRDQTRLAHLVRAAHVGFYRGLQARLSERGFMMGHWIFLRVLWQDDNLTQRELSTRAGLRDPTTFAALKGMEKLGLIRRRANPKNRREVRVSLTKKGRGLERTLLPIALEMNEIAVRGIDRRSIATVRRVLKLMTENFAEAESLRRTNGRSRKGLKAVAPSRIKRVKQVANSTF